MRVVVQENGTDGEIVLDWPLHTPRGNLASSSSLLPVEAYPATAPSALGMGSDSSAGRRSLLRDDAARSKLDREGLFQDLVIPGRSVRVSGAGASS